MLYQTYQTWSDGMAWMRAAASMSQTLLSHLPESARSDPMMRAARALVETVGLCGLTHRRPHYGIGAIEIGGRDYEVVEEVVDPAPFGTLIRFAKPGAPEQPRVLLVAPMSGHFATLLRGTIRTLLSDHDVYLTDWHNARDVALRAGRFGLSDYVGYLVRHLRTIGPGAHVLAVCQPCVAALAAAALLSEDGSDARPKSMTLMAGPIDARANPTQVNKLAAGRPIEWFERNMISTVPLRHAGAGRRVYPGFLQLVSFMSMNPLRHGHALFDFLHHTFKGDVDKSDGIREFYDEYLATADLPAEFYLETVHQIFQRYALARGELRVGDRLVRPEAIERCMLVTIEGEKDDICSVGQTVAAQELCSSLRPWMRRHHVQTGAGHYGVFNGRRWEQEIYPLVRETIALAEGNSRIRRIPTVK